MSADQVPVPEPSFEDYELAVRAMSGAKLKAYEQLKLETAALVEAKYRIENAMRSSAVAGRAKLFAMMPQFLATLEGLLTATSLRTVRGEAGEDGEPGATITLQTPDNPTRLGACRLYAGLTIPELPQHVNHQHVHQVQPEDREALRELADSSQKLSAQLALVQPGRAIDLSRHLYKGEAAKPDPTASGRPKHLSESV